MTIDKSEEKVQASEALDEKDQLDKMLHERRLLLQRKVLDMLRNRDPVRGIYAMYGAHSRLVECSKKK